MSKEKSGTDQTNKTASKTANKTASKRTPRPRHRGKRGKLPENNPDNLGGKTVFYETGDTKHKNGQTVKVSQKRDDLLSPDKIKIPLPPTPSTENSKPEREEQQVARMEILMLKGIRDPHVLKELLNIEDYRQVKRFMSRVHARWEITSGGKDILRHRGEALRRFDILEQELWTVVSNSGDDVRAKIVAIEAVLKLNDRKLPLLGVTPDSVAALENLASRNKHDARISQHKHVADMANRFKELLNLQPVSKVTEGEVVDEQ